MECKVSDVRDASWSSTKYWWTRRIWRALATSIADDAYRVREAADQLVNRDRGARSRALGVVPAEDKIVIRQELRVVVDVVDRELDSGMDLQTTSPA